MATKINRRSFRSHLSKKSETNMSTSHRALNVDKKEDQKQDFESLDSTSEELGIEEDEKMDYNEKVELEEEELEWLEDVTVPEGWKTRKIPEGVSKFNVFCLMSPSGKVWKSRQAALRVLLEQGVEEEEVVEELRRGLEHESWREHPLLPGPLWRFRDSTTLDILSGRARQFKSLKQVVDHIGKNFDEDTATNFSMFVEIQTAERLGERYSWTEDNSLPAGWKMRTGGRTGRSYFLSSDGQQFASRTLGYQHLIREQFDREHVEEMRGCLVSHEGWTEHPLLPAGWLFKKDANRGNNVLLLSSQGVLCKSFISAMEQLKANPEAYTEVDHGNLRKLMEERSVEQRRESYEWSEDDSLPDGWRMKVSDSRTGKHYFLSPSGEQFPSIKRAYQHLVRENTLPAHIHTMRQVLLSSMGWMEGPNIPAHWLFRKVLVSKKVVVTFLTSEGNECKSFLAAEEHMKSLPGVYSVKEFEDLAKLKLENGVQNRCETFTWSDDPSLPTGWKTRKVNKRLYFLGRKGQTVKGRRNMLRTLVGENYLEEEVERFRRSLTEEGWTENDLLPEGWMVRWPMKTRHEIQFLSSEGTEFKGLKQAAGHIQSMPEKYGENNLAKILVLGEQTFQKTNISSGFWEKGENLPVGWKVKNTGRKVYFLSKEGHLVKGRKNMLSHILEQGYSENVVEQFRKDFSKDCWTENLLLPPKWRMKIISRKDQISEVKFMTSQGNVLHGLKSAIRSIRSMPETYTETDVNKLKLVYKNNLKEKRVLDCEWTAEESLPCGWKTKSTPTRKNFFLSPDGHRFDGRISTLKYLISQSYDEKVIDQFREELSKNGWKRHKLLPENWRVRTPADRQGKTHEVQFLSGRGELFHGARPAVEFMRSDKDQYSQLSMDGIEQLLRENLVQTRLENLECWVKACNLPAGWRTKNLSSGRVFFLSQEGLRLIGRIKMLKHLIDKNFDQDEIETFREELSKNGWRKSNLLPDKWRVRTPSDRSGKTHEVQFLSCRGELFHGARAATQYMSSSPTRYGQLCLDGLNQLMGQNLLQTRLDKTESWVKGENLPDGWKMKTTGGKVFFLNPEGKQFKGRRMAFLNIIAQDYPEHEIEKFREELSQEGWEADHLLPDRWMVRRHKGADVEFLTCQGVRLVGYKGMWRELEEAGEEDREKFSMFIEVETVRRVVAEYTWLTDPTLPPGWRFREVEGKRPRRSYLSPEGQQVASRMAALQHLLEEGVPGEEVEAMRNTLKHEGWQQSNHLPQNWFYKPNKWHLDILSEEGECFRSFQTATEFMVKQHPKYPESSIAALKLLMADLPKHGTLYHSSTFLEEPKEDFEIKEEPGEDNAKDIEYRPGSENQIQVRSKKNSKAEVVSGWKEDSMLPGGWKWNPSNKRYKSPGGEKFHSLLSCLQFMLGNNSSVEDVETMRACLTLEHWEESELLPPGWRIREQGQKGKGFILTRGGKLLTSYVSAEEAIQASGTCDHTDVANIKRLYIQNKRLKAGEANRAI